MPGKKKEPEPFKRPKDLERAIAEGRDPNADLEKGETDTKAEAALSLAMSGASNTNIAKTLNYSSAYRARMAWERVLASAADSPLERDRMRVLNDRRYNRLLMSVMSKAVDPKDPEHLAYNARALAIIDRIGKQWGLDAPAQVQITATDETIANYTAKYRELAEADSQAEEADIIDAEVVDGDEDDEGQGSKTG